MLPNIKNLVKNKKAKFSFYRNGELWYSILEDNEDIFEFPVSINDTGDGVFLAEDKAIFFMRWIRKHLDFLRGAYAEKDAIIP